MAEASFPVQVVGGVPVVAAPEEIDITNAAGLRAALLEAAAHGSGTLVVDMAQTQFCDSAGLNVLVRAHKRARADGGELLLVICAAAVLRIFAVTGIDHLIPNFPDLEQARAPGPAPPAAPKPLGPLMTSSAPLTAADVLLLVEDDPGGRAANQGSLRRPSPGPAVARRRRRRCGSCAAPATSLACPALPRPCSTSTCPAAAARRFSANSRPARPAHHPRGGVHHLAGTGRHPAQLPTARQRPHRQAVRRRPVRRRDQAHR